MTANLLLMVRLLSFKLDHITIFVETVIVLQEKKYSGNVSILRGCIGQIRAASSLLTPDY
jgi:AMMECR1 domain-containing protein